MDLNNYKDLLNEASELYNKIPKKKKLLWRLLDILIMKMYVVIF